MPPDHPARPTAPRPAPAPPAALAARRGATPGTTLTTMLTPNERLRVDAAGAGIYHALHRETLDDVIRDVRERGATAVLVSVACCAAGDPARVATMVREFPRVPAVALLSDAGPATPQAVLSLGRSGVQRLVDARHPSGWGELRRLLQSGPSAALERSATALLAADLAGAPDGCRRFFEALFAAPADVCTVRQLTRGLGVVPSTLMSRFLRAGLPSPKRYLAMARLARAARLFENSGMSIANVAARLEYSSPQSFGRHVRTLLGTTAGRFRQDYDGDGMVERFRAELVRPHTAVLRRFDPLRMRL